MTDDVFPADCLNQFTREEYKHDPDTTDSTNCGPER